MFAQTYPTLEAFYAADARRRYSRERDVGRLWCDSGTATFRAAWVQGTREVYLFMYERIDGSGGTVEVLERRFGERELGADVRRLPRGLRPVGFAAVVPRAGRAAAVGHGPPSTCSVSCAARRRCASEQNGTDAPGPG